MGQLKFVSYRDDVVGTAAALVNQLTPGTDGARPVELPLDTAARRSALGRVSALAGETLGPADVEVFTALAAQLRPIFECCAEGDVDAAAGLVNELLAEHRSAPRLSRHGGDPWHLHFHHDDAGTAEGWAAGCATGLAIVLGGGDADRLGICTATPCDRVYVDTSRNGQRRFCSVRCANRFSVAAHRARRRGKRPDPEV